MSDSARRMGTALGAGLLFGSGLVLSGMTQPRKVLGFLDVFGDWDPSLMFVMIGAVGVHALAYRLARRRARPLLALRFSIPPLRAIDTKLMLGAAVFGVGWGLSGYCPGPALVALRTATPGVLIFVSALLAGLWITGKVEELAARPASQRARASDPARSP